MMEHKSLHCVKTGCTVQLAGLPEVYIADAFEEGKMLLFNCNLLPVSVFPAFPDFIVDESSIGRFSNNTIIISKIINILILKLIIRLSSIDPC